MKECRMSSSILRTVKRNKLTAAASECSATERASHQSYRIFPDRSASTVNATT